MKIKLISFFIIGLCITHFSFGQTNMDIIAVLNDSTHTFNIQHKIEYENSSPDTLISIYLNDWANSYKDKSTPLAKRFAEDYIRRFHFAKTEERGNTRMYSVSNANLMPYNWERPVDAADIIRIDLDKPLLPGEKQIINLLYSVKVPSDKFTRYGYDDEGNFKLNYWYVTPAVYKKGWQIYSDKNLGNQYTPPVNISIKLSTRPYLYIASPLKTDRLVTEDLYKTTYLSGKNSVSSQLYLTKSYRFESIQANKTEIISNLDDEGLSKEIKATLLSRIMKFLEIRLGEYPQSSLMVTRDEYLNNPVYGLNQLPSFLRPFPDGFQYDIKQLKTITNQFVKNTILVNPRNEQWVYDALVVSLMMDYVDEYYPNTKLLGSLSDFLIIEWFHASDLEFNDQYPFMYLHMARKNIDQSLSTAQDSLVKFNKNIGNAYKAGAGLKYLDEYLQSNTVKKSISEYYKNYVLKPSSEEDFLNILQKNTEKDISWFKQDYVRTNEKIDFKISKLKKTPDSLRVTIKNKRDNNMPISLYGLNDGKVVYKTWVGNIQESKQVTIPKDSIDRLALNYEGVVPEVNQRNNYRRVTTLLNKPVQFRLFQDIEDPRYNQFFFMPEFNYNLYDGISIGPKLYNKTFLDKNFEWKVSPKYGFTSQTIVGSVSANYTNYLDDENLFAMKFGFGGNRFSYGYNLFYEKFTPFVGLYFRNSYLRDNQRQSLTFRNVNVKQDIDPLDPVEQPKYNVVNLSYNFSDTNLIDYFRGGVDYQIAKNFSKVSLTLEYRKLFKNNQQLNLRFFAGTFLFNDETDNDYFSFALDRPSDYLFDYNYYGRSQDSGLFSQQIIVAEGGFKSQLEPEFANQWITTANASTNLWKWIYAYGDVGLVKNEGFKPKFVYDSGIRMSFVADYFEVFLPVYSNLGWEIGQKDYDQKIRFIVTLDINTLIRLFTREWY
ncbi:M1 family metallopeptidase [Gillisia hiemivivida]|uniref:M1 family metallopeptidase n=1 Tax=Gillisia hiemivivida TaxID=291190 RepID=A0A5C6ZW26_9FLAO|nr:M1 family metallopeptidase [Gillisia hiemivivida]TXD94467.1 M1 family metallopeptidase [Gillisia hiemivivida]